MAQPRGPYDYLDYGFASNPRFPPQNVMIRPTSAVMQEIERLVEQEICARSRNMAPFNTAHAMHPDVTKLEELLGEVHTLLSGYEYTYDSKRKEVHNTDVTAMLKRITELLKL